MAPSDCLPWTEHSIPQQQRNSIMQARHLLAALAAGVSLFGASASFAGETDGCTTIANGIMHCWTPSQRTREAVKADLHNAQAAGQLRAVGELSGAPEGQAVPAQQAGVTRAEVRHDLALARSAHEVPHGDL
jgi:hypothetical protein